MLLTVARRKALDRLRGATREAQKTNALSLFIEEAEANSGFSAFCEMTNE